jgi:hypothetical protein
LVGPTVIKLGSDMLKSGTRTGIKIGFMMTEKVKELCAEAGEEFEDIVAEAKPETSPANKTPARRK